MIFKWIFNFYSYKRSNYILLLFLQHHIRVNRNKSVKEKIKKYVKTLILIRADQRFSNGIGKENTVRFSSLIEEAF